ncbi:hypothetical protein SEA_NORZ_87 [Mycobacterium phage Norz]|nr:hypothetical protein SEA_NORZ_87 [Mycobacterium phage Norz]
MTNTMKFTYRPDGEGRVTRFIDGVADGVVASSDGTTVFEPAIAERIAKALNW